MSLHYTVIKAFSNSHHPSRCINLGLLSFSIIVEYKYKIFFNNYILFYSPPNMKKLFRSLSKSLPLAISFFILSNYFLPLLNFVDFSVQAAPYSDILAFGDIASENAHNISGWSSLDIPGGYGGCNGGANCHYRQIIEESECNDDSRTASATFHIGDHIAQELTIRHLNGITDDSFEVYVNSTEPENLIGNYDWVDSPNEYWEESEFTLNNLTGDFTVILKATGDIWGSCSTYGQGAVSWIEVSGYTQPDAPENLGWNTEQTHPGDPGHRDVEISCGGYTNQNRISHNWSEAADADGYQRQYKYPNTSNWITSSIIYTDTYTPFSSFGSTSGVEGMWNTQVRVKDTNNDWSEWSNDCTITYDITDPVVQITTPSDESIVKGTITIEGNIVEDNLSHYNLSLNPGSNYDDTWTFSNRLWQVSGSSNDLSHTLDTTAFPDGDYMIRLAARDLAGNRDPMPSAGTGVSVHVIYITIDNEQPEVIWTDPSDGQIKNGNVTLEATCDGGATESQYVNFWWWKASEDQAIKVDSDLNNGDDDAFENHQYHYVRRGDPSTGTVVENTFSWDLDTTDDSLKSPNYPWDGEWRFRAACKDEAGNYKHAEINIIIDNTEPTSELYLVGRLDEPPVRNDDYGWHGYGWYESYNNVNLQIAIGDLDNDVINYQILSGDSECPAIGGAGYTAVDHDTNINSDINTVQGVHTLCYYAEDSAGNTEAAVHKQLLHIDSINPEFTIDYNSINGNEKSGIYYIDSDTINVDIEVSDNLSGYTRARYDLYTADEDWNCTKDHSNEDNLPIPSISTTRTLTQSGLADGNYCLRIWIYDDVQNKAWSDTNGQGWVHFVIDTTPPDITNVSVDKEYVKEGDTITITAEVTDDSGISAVSADFSYNLAYTDRPTPTSISMTNIGGDTYQASYIVPAGWNEGTMYIKVAARDGTGGNWIRSSEYVEVIVDNTPPTIDTINDQSFNEGESVDLGILDGLGIHDNIGLSQICYNLDSPPGFSGPPEITLPSSCEDISLLGTGNTISSSTGIFFPIDTSVLFEGEYTLNYYVTDLAGNRSDCNLEENGEQNCSVIITITNVTPIVTLGSDQTINEGSSATFTGSFNDPSYIEDSPFFYDDGDDRNNPDENTPDDAPWTVEIDYGEGAGYQPIGNMAIPGNVGILPHQYSSSGTYPVILKVCEGTGDINEDGLQDGEGECRTDTVTITVNSAGDGDDGNGENGNNNNDDGNDGDDNNDTGAGTGGGVGGTYTGAGGVSGAVQAVSDDSDAIVEESQDSEEEQQILGEEICENLSKVSGYIYYDNNSNNQKDEDENGLENVLVAIYQEVEGEEEVITTTRTDENGYWEAEVCPGNYKIKIDEESLPEKTELEGKALLDITIVEFENLSDINFTVKTTKSFLENFNWLWCLIPLVLIFLLILLYIVFKQKDKNNKSNVVKMY